MKYYYSLLEGLVLLFDLDEKRDWAYKVINAKRDFKRYKDANRILELFGGKGSIHDNVLFREDYTLRNLGQAWFEQLCCYVLKTTNIILETGELSLTDIIRINRREYKKITHNKKLGEKYSTEKTVYYDYQARVNDLIVEGVKCNNIEKVILRSMGKRK